MGQIDITRNEFRKSYKEHYRLYQEGNSEVSPASRKLLLFYAVECGLKSLILKQIGKEHYSDLKQYSQNNGKHIEGHDVKAMILELDDRQQFILNSISLKTGKKIRAGHWNELWRYGASVEDKKEEEKAEKTLGRIAEWIDRKL